MKKALFLGLVAGLALSVAFGVLAQLSPGGGGGGGLTPVALCHPSANVWEFCDPNDALGDISNPIANGYFTALTAVTITISGTVAGNLNITDDNMLQLGTTLDQVMLNQSTLLAADAEVTAVIEGTSEHPGVAANSLIVSNITNDGDILLAVSKAGNSQGVFWADGSTGDTAVMASSGQSVDTYIAGTKEIDYATGAMAFQQATTISTTATTLTLDPATNVLIGNTKNLLPATTDGSQLGSGTLMFSDLFLASGGVLNFNNGNVTITHSAGTLTLNDTVLGVGLSGAFQFGSVNNAITQSAGSLIFTAGGASRFTVAGDVDPSIDIMSRTATGLTAERQHLRVNTRNLTLADATTIATFRKVSIAQDTYLGLAAGGTETVTDATTFYITGAPINGGNLTLTNAYALWVDAGTSRFDGTVQTENAAGYALLNEAASATNPTMVPNVADLDTGIGSAAADQLSLIAGGIEGLRLTEGTAVAGSIAAVISAASSTDNTSLTITNSSNAAAASHSIVDIAVGGTTSTGDPQLRLTVPSGTSYYIGSDNSSNDSFFIGTGTAVGSNPLVRIVTETSGPNTPFLTLTPPSVTSSAANSGESGVGLRLIGRTMTINTATPWTASTLIQWVNIQGQTIDQSNGAGTVDKYAGIGVAGATAGASVTITHSSAFRALTGGAAVNASGLFLEAQTAGTTGNYQILMENGGGVRPALANHVGLTVLDFAAGDARLYVIPEAGSDINFGNDIMSFTGATGSIRQGSVDLLSLASGSLVVNEASADIDFRIESNDNANMFTVNGGTNGVGIGQAASAGSVLVAGWDNATMAAGTTAARHINIQGNITELANATITDIVGAYFNTFTITDGGGTETVGTVATVYINNAPTAGTTPSNGPYALFVDAGTTRFDGLIAFGGETVDIGTSTVGLNDLHFGSGGIINFDGSDVTITHAANQLTIAGGDIQLDADLDFVGAQSITTTTGNLTIQPAAGGDTIIGDGAIATTIEAVGTLGTGVTTFAVDSNIVTVAGDGGGNTVATITGGVSGQILTILFSDTLITITDTDAHTANTVDLSAAFTSADDTVLQLLFDGTSWYQVSRSNN